MLPREFERRVNAFQEERKELATLERDRHYSRMNAAGLAFHGKRWKWLDPKDTVIREDLGDREAKALKRLAERRQRKAVA